MKKRIVPFLASVLIIAAIPFLLPATDGNSTEKSANTNATQSAELPVVGSFANLQNLLKQERMKNSNRVFYAVAEMDASAPASGQAPSAPAYSTTNLQVQGVDEADIVKTDGTYLYQTTSQEIRIAQIYPANSMEVVSRISYDPGKFQPLEMFVDEKRMVVIGDSFADYFAASDAAKANVMPYENLHTVKVLVYDIADKRQPRLLRELDVEGNYLSSRKIGSSFYLVTNRYIDLYRVLENRQEDVPLYRDLAQGNQFRAVPYNEIRYFPENPAANYLLVAGLDLDDPADVLNVDAYLGGGENLYASRENLYVAVTHQTFVPTVPEIAIWPPPRPVVEDTKTVVYRFALKKGELSYSGKGSVPGRILNQFSMDEHNGYFRIATTSGNIRRTDEGTSKNNLYVLGKDMEIHGRLEGIAPGEKIYSVRFMQDRAYMVTFRTVDPLFVIDLHKPESPAVLGKLKIPGYSDYLHPYDEHHLIGFGKEAVADKDMAYYQGMKIALFDVSDVSHPVEKFNTVIGDRGTDSELLSNHKALLFSREQNLLAFPVTVMKLNEEQRAKRTIQDYGSFHFQGAYIYQIDLEKGFTLASTVTHLDPQDVLRAGSGWYQSEKNVRRILTIGDTLYTVSDSMVKAQQLSTHQPLATLKLVK